MENDKSDERKRRKESRRLSLVFPKMIVLLMNASSRKRLMMIGESSETKISEANENWITPN